jgi:hypothetical protein
VGSNPTGPVPQRARSSSHNSNADTPSPSPVQARTGRKRKYAYLLEDSHTRTWHTNLANDDGQTADTYLRRLGWFDKERKIDPQKLPTQPVEEIEAIVIDLINRMKKEKALPGYIGSVVKAIKSWLKSRHIELLLVKMPKGKESPKYRDEMIPMKEELRSVLNAEDIRSKLLFR